MIREEELLEAIAECQGERNPNANTCRNLAAYYTILDHVRSVEAIKEVPTYSYAAEYEGESEFAKLTKGKSTVEILELMDELMDTLSVLNPRLYDSVIQKLRGR